MKTFLESFLSIFKKPMLIGLLITFGAVIVFLVVGWAKMWFGHYKESQQEIILKMEKSSNMAEEHFKIIYQQQGEFEKVFQAEIAEVKEDIQEVRSGQQKVERKVEVMGKEMKIETRRQLELIEDIYKDKKESYIPSIHQLVDIPYKNNLMSEPEVKKNDRRYGTN